MKVLNGLLCLIAALCICASAGFKSIAANAVQNVMPYAYADLGSETYICAEKDEATALFIIPQTYCVEVLSRDGGWLHVKYAEDNGIYRAVYGYVKEDGVVPVSKPLENMYLNTTVTVIYRADVQTGNMPAPKEMEVSAAYYGAYTIGMTACSYVFCNEYFAYISGVIENYPLNELPATGTFAEAEKGNSAATLITALVISFVAAAALVALYFTGKRPKLDELKNQAYNKQ